MVAFADQNCLQTEIIEAQELNKALVFNLEEWKMTNNHTEKTIIEQQSLNVSLVENLNEWQLANQQIETEIISLQRVNEGLQSEIKSLETLREEKKELSNLNQIAENLIRTQKQLLTKQETNADEMFKQYENLLSLKQNLIVKLEQENEKYKSRADLTDFKGALTANLDEWQATNKNLEEMILGEQNLNENLMKNYNEWQTANIQIESLNNQELKQKLKEIESLKEEKESR